MKFFLLAILVVMSTRVQAEKATWNLNDVTYLFPLTLDQNLKASDQQLLPSRIYSKLPPPMLSPTSSISKSDWFNNIRVVGVRVDPQAMQVRMTWQVIYWNEDQSRLTTKDSGIHTFYSLTKTQMKTLLNGLWNLKQEGLEQTPVIDTTRLPLQVHPAFSHPIFAIRFMTTLKKLLLKDCSSKNLVQATVMQGMSIFENVSSNGWWEFSGFRKAAGKWEPLAIPRFSEAIEKLSNEGNGTDLSDTFPTGMRAQVVPPFLEGESLDKALSGGHIPNESDRPVFEKAMRLVRVFQNPKLTTADALDCAQCHLTEGAHFWMNSTLKNVERPGLTEDVRFENPNPALYDLKNVTSSVKSSKILRALGYWKSFPAVNQRVINETAIVADFLNTLQTAR